MTSTKGPDGQPIMGKMASKAFQRSTLGRPGRPEEIAAPILLLASRGGMYMNDTCINVDGGRWMVSLMHNKISATQWLMLRRS